MATTITYRGSRDELLARLRQLPGALSGRLPDSTGAVRGVVLSAGVALLGCVQDNYRAASEGAPNALTGEPWEPLAASTLALRRKQAGPKVVARLEAAFASLPEHRQRLVRRQYQRVIQLYEAGGLGTHRGPRLRRAALGILERMKPHITPARYKGLKAELTGKPKADKAHRLAYAAAHALILRDTGRLFNSLGPALKGGGEQLLKVEPCALSVGTNVNYAKYHQSDRPRKLSKRTGKPRLPRRQFLPDPGKMPINWWRAVTGAITKGLASPSFWYAYLSA